MFRAHVQFCATSWLNTEIKKWRLKLLNYNCPNFFSLKGKMSFLKSSGFLVDGLEITASVRDDRIARNMTRLDTQNHDRTQTVQPVDTRMNLEVLACMKPYSLQKRAALKGTLYWLRKSLWRAKSAFVYLAERINCSLTQHCHLEIAKDHETETPDRPEEREKLQNL